MAFPTAVNSQITDATATPAADTPIKVFSDAANEADLDAIQRELQKNLAARLGSAASAPSPQGNASALPVYDGLVVIFTPYPPGDLNGPSGKGVAALYQTTADSVASVIAGANASKETMKVVYQAATPKGMWTLCSRE